MSKKLAIKGELSFSDIKKDESVNYLYTSIKDLTDIKNLLPRPSWDEYFCSIAQLTATRSPCERAHVGAVVVKNNRILSTGYNGFPAGAPHESVVRDGHEQNTIHAEVNALSYTNRDSIDENTIIYTTKFPCINCAKMIITYGIKNVVYMENYKNDELVIKMFKTGNVNVRQFK